MTWEHLPGYIVRADEAHGETTVVVERERLLDAALHLRDAEGFEMLSDVVARRLPRLGRGRRRRLLGQQPSDATRTRPAPGASRSFRRAEAAALLRLLSPARTASGPPRLRLQVWCDDGEPVPSVVSVWPTADWPSARSVRPHGHRLRGPPEPRPDLMPRTTGRAIRFARTTRSAASPSASRRQE